MDKQILEPMSGFRDYNLPTKDWVIGVLRETFQKYGYLALETPSLEKQDILLGKLGDEGQKQLYLFEDNGGRKVGLRYDLTVPLARFVAGNYQQLPMPFKRYEIGNGWRAERPQKGRYRQFTQADVDIIGAPEPYSELELFSIAAAAFEALGVEIEYQINDRRLIAEVFNKLKVEESVRKPLLMLLDKREKLTDKEFNDEFKQLGLSDVERRTIAGLFLGTDAEDMAAITKLIDNLEITQTLEAVLDWAKKQGINAKFTPSMVRGLDYYTGTIFEIKAANYDGGTVAAGGRYDNLIEGLTGQKVPAVGLSFGVDRLADLLADKKLPQPLFMVRLPETSSELDLWVQELRKNNQKVEVYLDETVDLGKQIKYADKRGYSDIYIPFEDEWKKGQIVVKNLETGTQKAVKRDTVK